jgi:hypothetical protein
MGVKTPARWRGVGRARFRRGWSMIGLIESELKLWIPVLARFLYAS